MISDFELSALLPETLVIARNAGDVLMKHYKAHIKNDSYLKINTKDDGSPVCIADEESSDLIVTALKKLTPDVTAISEESRDKPEAKNGDYWTIDPLDGTTGFTIKNNHFYIKIARIEDGKATLGVIYEPVQDRAYHAIRGGKAFCITQEQGQRIIQVKPAKNTQQTLRTLFNSLFHKKEAYKAAQQELAKRNIHIPPLEQAAGMCKTAFYMAVATGMADIFVDCGLDTSLANSTGFSWDYAPDSLILNNAGGVMIDLATGNLPRFDDPYKKMNALIGLADRELGKRAFPELKTFAFNL